MFNCSFCGKSQREVAKLIAGPNVYICNECVAVCAQVIVEQGGTLPVPRSPALEKLPLAKLLTGLGEQPTIGQVLAAFDKLQKQFAAFCPEREELKKRTEERHREVYDASYRLERVAGPQLTDLRTARKTAWSGRIRSR